MNLLLIVVAVILLFVLAFDIVALASVQSGWFTRSSTQPSAGLNSVDDRTTRVHVNYEFGTLGYCGGASEGGVSLSSPAGCHGYKTLESTRGDLPSDSAIRGASRGGQAAFAFCLLSVLTALGALILAALLGVLFFDPDPAGLIGTGLSALNIVFSVLAWAIMVGMHSDGELGSITCNLSDAELDYAFFLSLFGSILALIATPLFLYGSFGSALRDRGRGYTRLAAEEMPGTSQEMLIHHAPPPDDGIPYTLMATEEPVSSSLDWKRL